MNNLLKITKNENISKYPTSLPFVVESHTSTFMVFYDTSTGKYRYVDLVTGKTSGGCYQTLEELFYDNENDIVVNCELLINGN